MAYNDDSSGGLLDIRNGARVAGFLVLIDGTGRRYALRLNAILGLQDVDECGDQTLVTITGGRSFVVPKGLDEVLGWLSAGVSPSV
ncbi:hypothetical protein [Azospirillum sp. sgz301742]